MLSLSKREVEAKLATKTVHVEHFQHKGEEMRFDGAGWVPGQSGVDPDGSWDITGVSKVNGDPSDDALIDCLRQVDNIHKEAREAIADWFADYRKAKPNPAGVTGVPRNVPSNERSRTPGPHPALLSEKNCDQLKAELEGMRKIREETELRVQLEKEKAQEGRKWLDAKTQLNKMQKR